MTKKLTALILIGVFALSLIPISASAKSIIGLDIYSDDNHGMIKNSENYTKAKARSTELTQKWDTAKKGLSNIRSIKPVLTDQKPSIDSNKSIEKYREFLQLTIDRVINRLQILSYWVDKVIEDGAKKEELLNIIKNDISDLEDLRKSVNEAKTIEELKDLSKKIKEKWKETQFHIKRIINDILSNRLENMIERFETVSDKLHKKIDALDQSSKIVGEMQDLLDQFDEHVKLAKEEYELYRKALTSPASNAAENVEEARKHLRNVHKHLKEAHSTLKEILKLYREYNSTTGPTITNKPLYLDIGSSEDSSLSQ